jgi:hypothetical protein
MRRPNGVDEWRRKPVVDLRPEPSAQPRPLTGCAHCGTRVALTFREAGSRLGGCRRRFRRRRIWMYADDMYILVYVKDDYSEAA